MNTLFKDINEKKDTIIKVYPKQHDNVAYTIHYTMKNNDDLNTIVKESKLSLWLRAKKTSGV